MNVPSVKLQTMSRYEEISPYLKNARLRRRRADGPFRHPLGVEPTDGKKGRAGLPFQNSRNQPSFVIRGSGVTQGHREESGSCLGNGAEACAAGCGGRESGPFLDGERKTGEKRMNIRMFCRRKRNHRGVLHVR